jgi:hypothetical protein
MGIYRLSNGVVSGAQVSCPPRDGIRRGEHVGPARVLPAEENDGEILACDRQKGRHDARAPHS